MRKEQPWEGPTSPALAPLRARAAELAGRPPVALDCLDCGHEWESRAKPGTVLRCPSCRHPRRVPADLGRTDPPAGSRRLTPPPPAPVRPVRTPRPAPVRSPRPARQEPVRPRPAARPAPQPPARPPVWPSVRPTLPTPPAPAPLGLGGLLGQMFRAGMVGRGLTPPATHPTAPPAPPVTPTPGRPAASGLFGRPRPVPPAPRPVEQVERAGRPVGVRLVDGRTIETDPDALADALRRIEVAVSDPSSWRMDACWVARYGSDVCGNRASHIVRVREGVWGLCCQQHASVISRWAAVRDASIVVVMLG